MNTSLPKNALTLRNMQVTVKTPKPCQKYLVGISSIRNNKMLNRQRELTDTKVTTYFQTCRCSCSLFSAYASIHGETKNVMFDKKVC
mmetsp:Transcript_13497/g.20112  ORF Transcript_13497/g.20112 Transcript_13497/m.20112 type:complete len:87 (+) Transcript_13497:304-564(+)